MMEMLATEQAVERHISRIIDILQAQDKQNLLRDRLRAGVEGILWRPEPVVAKTRAAACHNLPEDYPKAVYVHLC